jgi:hypothetical protein
MAYSTRDDIQDAKTGQPVASLMGVGLRNVGSYQVSGYPFLSGGFVKTLGESKIAFPTVTKSVTVIASGNMTGDLRVHFVSTGSSTNVNEYHHYISLANTGQSVTMNVKCEKMYISSPNSGDRDTGFQLFAELTHIPTGSMYEITGAGHTNADAMVINDIGVTG